MATRAALRRWLSLHRDLVVIAIAALVVRVVWNLWIHPPLDYVYSDMGGYLERAATRLDHPDGRFPYFTFFPWGTHVLLSLLMEVFGRANRAPTAVVYALFGVASVVLSAAIAARLTRKPWVTRIVGAILVVYYPWISLGGYTLSEPPFTTLLCATVFFTLRLADRGKPFDAWAFGVSLGLGAIFRPQILAALPLLGVLFLTRRQMFRRFSPWLLPPITMPLVILLALSAHRMLWHTGSFGLISNNGPFNYAMGRCHAVVISASTQSRKSSFRSTSLSGLADHEAEDSSAFFRLDPAIKPTLAVEGGIWQSAPFYKLASQCLAKTGFMRQAHYAVSNVALLWAFNVMWPDQLRPPRFRTPMVVAGIVHELLFLPPAALAIGLAFTKRRARTMLVALHVIGIVFVAAVYFGDTRIRAPYDGLIVVLAVATLAAIIRRARSRWLKSV